MTSPLRYRRAIRSRPKKTESGQFFRVVGRNLIENRAEEALITAFISDRQHFGFAYSEIQADYFFRMPKNSGVFISPMVRTKDLIPSAQRPGDIDLLVIPYEGDELVLDRLLAIEVKAVRARYNQQGKSPNEYGFSQGLSLLELGFPYVAVAHLIISDISPTEHWQVRGTARIADETGRVYQLGRRKFDPMPENLLKRTTGRLKRNCSIADLGLISAYIFSPLFENVGTNEHMILLPEGRQASPNHNVQNSTLDAVAAYFDNAYENFLDTPRFDPPK